MRSVLYIYYRSLTTSNSSLLKRTQSACLEGFPNAYCPSVECCESCRHVFRESSSCRHVAQQRRAYHKTNSTNSTNSPSSATWSPVRRPYGPMCLRSAISRSRQMGSATTATGWTSEISTTVPRPITPRSSSVKRLGPLDSNIRRHVYYAPPSPATFPQISVMSTSSCSTQPFFPASSYWPKERFPDFDTVMMRVECPSRATRTIGPGHTTLIISTRCSRTEAEPGMTQACTHVKGREVQPVPVNYEVIAEWLRVCTEGHPGCVDITHGPNSSRTFLDFVSWRSQQGPPYLLTRPPTVSTVR